MNNISEAKMKKLLLLLLFCSIFFNNLFAQSDLKRDGKKIIQSAIEVGSGEKEIITVIKSLNNYEIGLFWTIASPQLYTQNVLPLNSELINLLRKKINEGGFKYIPYDVDEELCYVLRKTEEKKFILPSQEYIGPSGARIDIPFKTNRISEENLMKDKSLENLFKVYLLNYGQRNIKISLFKK